MKPTDQLANCTASTAQGPALTQEQMLANIRSAMAKLKAAPDPLRLFFKNKNINVDTHDVYINDCHKSVLVDPPAYVKFSPHVEPDDCLAVERIDNNLLTPTHEKTYLPWADMIALKVTK